MSGSRHHFVPKFMQRGFLAKSKPKHEKTWLYSARCAPHEREISNIGLEGYFYSHNREKLLDDLITKAESSYAALVTRLRTGPSGLIACPDLTRDVHNLIVHLELRTRNLRVGLATATDEFARQLRIVVQDEDLVAGWLVNYWTKNPQKLKNTFLKNGVPHHKVGELMQSMYEKNSRKLRDLAYQLARNEKENFKKLLPSEEMGPVVKSAQLDAMIEALAPRLRCEAYSKLNLAVRDIPENNLILGDSMVFHKSAESGNWYTFRAADTLLDVSFLPISASRIIVAAVDPLTVPLEDLRTGVAGTSHEFFISNTKLSETDKLISMRGKFTGLLSVQDIEEILSDVFLTAL